MSYTASETSSSKSLMWSPFLSLICFLLGLRNFYNLEAPHCWWSDRDLFSLAGAGGNSPAFKLLGMMKRLHVYPSLNLAYLDSFAYFYLTDPLCRKLDQERKAWCPSQQKLKGKLLRDFLELGIFIAQPCSLVGVFEIAQEISKFATCVSANIQRNFVMPRYGTS